MRGTRFRVGKILAVLTTAIVITVATQATFAEASPSKWAISSSPNVGSGSQFYGVSCITASDCFGVGYSAVKKGGDNTLIEQWNGSHWAKVSSPNAGGTDFLSGIDCVNSTYCIAVGSYYVGSNVSPESTLVETWDGSTWSVLSSPNGDHMNFFDAVSCVDASDCLAVGGTTIGSGESAQDEPLIEWLNDGTWTEQSSPAITGNASLSGVSCNSTSTCTAVGGTVTDTLSGATQTVGETLSGSTWTLDSTPDPGSTYSELSGVYCLSSDDCIAVGAYTVTSSKTETLVATWNGSTWSVTPSASKNSLSALSGISCVTSSDCVSVGHYGVKMSSHGIVPEAFVEAWNGTTWKITTSPSRPSAQNMLAAVSCTTSTGCQAVGITRPFTGSKFETLAESGT